MADRGNHRAMSHFLRCVRARRTPLFGEEAFRTRELLDHIYHTCTLSPLN